MPSGIDPIIHNLCANAAAARRAFARAGEERSGAGRAPAYRSPADVTSISDRPAAPTLPAPREGPPERAAASAIGARTRAAQQRHAGASALIERLRREDPLDAAAVQAHLSLAATDLYHALNENLSLDGRAGALRAEQIQHGIGKMTLLNRLRAHTDPTALRTALDAHAEMLSADAEPLARDETTAVHRYAPDTRELTEVGYALVRPHVAPSPAGTTNGDDPFAAPDRPLPTEHAFRAGSPESTDHLEPLGRAFDRTLSRLVRSPQVQQFVVSAYHEYAGALVHDVRRRAELVGDAAESANAARPGHPAAGDFGRLAMSMSRLAGLARRAESVVDASRGTLAAERAARQRFVAMTPPERLRALTEANARAEREAAEMRAFEAVTSAFGETDFAAFAAPHRNAPDAQ